MMDSLRPRLSEILYGGDYNPEQWPESVWAEDMARMQEAGINCVTVGVFSWAHLNPKPGEFTFDWMDRLFDLVEKHKIHIDLATATASPPAWLAHRYPEVRPVQQDGTVLYHGSRQAYTPNSLAYQEYASALVEQLASRYAKRDGLLLWHINNELSMHLPDGSFGPEDLRAWRIWLKEKYRDLNHLNQHWGTAFWSQSYFDWDEVNLPLTTPAQINPTMWLDWRRFWSDSLIALINREKAIIRKYDSDRPCTTNLVPNHLPTNTFQLSRATDLTSIDVYPDNQPSAGDGASFNAYAGDLARGINRGAPWLLMEQAVSYVNWRPLNTAKRPGIMRLWSLQHLARGAEGILYFQWRQSQQGGEKFHSALLPNTPPEQTRSWKEAVSLGAELKKLKPVLSSQTKAEVALLYDYESIWSFNQNNRPLKADANKFIFEYHQACLEENVSVDIVHPLDDLSGYRLVLAPVLHLVDKQRAANLEQFVEQGGTLVASFLTGVVDEHDALIPGGAPGHLRKLLGIWVEEWDAQPNDRENAIKLPEGNLVPTHTFAEVVHLDGARSIGNFARDYYAGSPALTLNLFGKGRSYYVACRPKFKFLRTALRTLVGNIGIRPPLEAPEGVETLERRGKSGQRFIFVLNRNETPRTISLGALEGNDLLTGKPLKTSVVLKGYDGIVLAVNSS